MTATEWRLTIKDNVITGLSQISAGADKASAQMAGLQKNIDQVGESAKKASFFGKMLHDALGLAAGFGINELAHSGIELFKESLNDYNAQEQALGQLKATWKSTGGAVGLAINEIVEQAEALQKVTLFPDEVTEQAQSLLMTFPNIKGKIFKDAIPAIQDLAAKTKSDLASAAQSIGKILESPAEGVRLLHRQYRIFTDEQQDGIKKLVDAGKTQEAQQIILTELNKKFGGSAEAAAKSGTGFLTQLKNDWGDVKEVIGELVVGMLKGIQPALHTIISGAQALMEGIKENKDMIVTVFKAMAAGLTTIGGALVLVRIKAAAYAVMQALSVGWTTLQLQGTLLLTIATKKLGDVMKANQFGIIITAIGLAVAAIKYFWDTSENFRGFLYGFWASIKTIFSNIGEFFKTIFTPILDGVNAVREGRWGDAAKSFGKGLLNIATPMGAVNALKEGKYKSVSEAYNNAYKDGLHDFYVEKAKEKSDKKKNETGYSQYSALTPADGSSAEKDLSKGLSDVSGGGKSVKNINVTIQRFTDKVEINTATVREGVNEMVSILEDAFIRVLSGAEAAIATNGQ
jgi:hypothetical protein